MTENNIDLTDSKSNNTSMDCDLHIYKARIYDNVKRGDDRLQVRILPFMANLTSGEEDLLPKYPSLIRGKVIRGYTEKEDGADKASIVFVVANIDFTVGYVIDLVNNFINAYDGALENSWQFQTVKQALTHGNALPDDFQYENIAVDLCTPSSNFIEFHDIVNGGKWWMTSTGDILSIAPHKVFMMARTGSGTGEQMSKVEVTPNKVNIITNTFNVNAKNVILGHHGMYPMGSIAQVPVSCEGVNLSPLTNIQL